MEKYKSAEDIYDELVENSDESWILGLVAFAVVEEQRIEWIKHQKANNGGSPDAGAITAWYEQLPQGVLLRAKDTAESRLKDYSDEIVSMLEDGLSWLLLCSKCSGLHLVPSITMAVWLLGFVS